MAHRNSSLMNTIFPCCNQKSSQVELLIEEATKDEESQNTELVQLERSLELQVIQAEQRLSALNLVRNKTNDKIKSVENRLSVSSRRSAEARNSKILAEKKEEIASLKTKISRLEKTFVRVQKYNGTLTAEIKGFEEQRSAGASQLTSLQNQIDEISAQIDDIRNQTQTSQQKLTSLQRESENKTKDIDEIRKKIEEKKQEIEFAKNMKSKFELQNAVPTIPSRRGRPRPRPISSVVPPTEDAPTPPAEDSPPRVPKRTSALAERMKMFQNQ